MAEAEMLHDPTFADVWAEFDAVRHSGDFSEHALQCQNATASSSEDEEDEWGKLYKKYNSLVDNVVNPSIFVVQHSNEAYPAYLLTYHT